MQASQLQAEYEVHIHELFNSNTVIKRVCWCKKRRAKRYFKHNRAISRLQMVFYEPRPVLVEHRGNQDPVLHPKLRAVMTTPNHPNATCYIPHVLYYYATYASYNPTAQLRAYAALTNKASIFALGNPTCCCLPGIILSQASSCRRGQQLSMPSHS
jgi:hypothetical protein